ncbi:hypothetical protein Tco_0207260, partial [Tanacetum coccineum]
EEGRKKKKALEADKSKQPFPTKQTKPVKEKTSKPTPSKKICKGRVMKVRKEKRLTILQAPVSGVAIRETDPGLIRELLEVEGKGKGIVSEERTPATQDASTGPSAQPQDDTSANVVYDTLSPADSTNDANNVADMELSTSKADTEILNVDEEHGEEVSHTVDLEEITVELDEGQAGSDP